MRVIVEHDEKNTSYLPQYVNQIEYLSPNFKIIDIDEQYLNWLSGITKYIEPNFQIELSKNEEYLSEQICNKHNIIVATIGTKKTNKYIDNYYNMKTYLLEQNHTTIDKKLCQWINCYSDTHQIDVIDYIKCIRYLTELSAKWHKPIVIYANVHVPDEMFRYRALAYKVINTYLEGLNGVLVTKSSKADIPKYYMPSQKAYEFYLDHRIYLEDSLNQVMIKAIPLLYTSHGAIKFKEMYRYQRQNGLFENDVFFGSIDPDEEIYIPLNLGNFREPQDYEALGVEHVALIGDYGMLYGKKSLFDELGEELQFEVAHPFYIPILSLTPCLRNNNIEQLPYSVTTDNLLYKGKGTYIGIVTVDDVDYTNPVLRTPDGRTRIACIWHQTRIDEGIYYHKEQIDEALTSENPDASIPLPKGETSSTVMLGIAGGRSRDPSYRGVATEAEFIVAKVNTAPESLQRLYGGMPSQYAVTMPDALIGALKLIHFARERQTPLALCIPFNTNIDPHDGSLILYQMLGLIAQREYLSIIIPTGEEADKMHHYTLTEAQPASSVVNIRVTRAEQNIVGIIYQKFANVFTANLYPPEGVVSDPIDLKPIGITNVQEATIYSNGYKISFLNGAIRILFRIDKPQIGEWRIEVVSDTESLSQIDIWISQQELNPFITLSPSSPFITVGSTGNTNNVMTVGGYNKESMIVLRSSGRGYSWDDRVKPLFITNGNNIIAPCKTGTWITTTGTLAASSIMLGVVSTIYSKLLEEEIFPFPNTLVMNSIILSAVKQFGELEYPNPSQGYGIFDLDTLNTILSMPFIL